MPIPGTSYLLSDSGYLLQEDGFRIIIAEGTGPYVNVTWCGKNLQLQSNYVRQPVADEVNVVYPLDGTTARTQEIFLSTYNTIQVPDGAVSAILIPEPGNLIPMYLCGANGDTGVLLHLTIPTFVPLALTTTEIIIRV